MPNARCERLVLATGNAHKARELAELLAPLDIPVTSLADFPTAQPAVELGSTLADNARQKASSYALRLGEWVLSDDTGLEVDALAGAPGVCSARYAGPQATMAENRAKLLGDLDRFPDEKRTARFVCHLAIADPSGEVVAQAAGMCRGRIRREPAGDLGFGYDSLFEIVEYHRTLAEISPRVTAALGHRGRAVYRLLTAWSP
jgi:XTP/dITP diphosphohydrolase